MISLLAPLSAPVLAELGAHPGFWEDVRFQTVGIVVVLLALVAIWLALEVVGSAFRRIESRRAPARIPAATEEPAPVPSAGPTAIPPEVIAVIAAAVDTTLGAPHRIVAVQLADSSSGHAAWSVEGRREIYRSHRVR